MKQTTLFSFLKPPAPDVNKGGRPKKKKNYLAEAKEPSTVQKDSDLHSKQTFLSKTVPGKIVENKPGECSKT